MCRLLRFRCSSAGLPLLPDHYAIGAQSYFDAWKPALAWRISVIVADHRAPHPLGRWLRGAADEQAAAANSRQPCQYQSQFQFHVSFRWPYSHSLAEPAGFTEPGGAYLLFRKSSVALTILGHEHDSSALQHAFSASKSLSGCALTMRFTERGFASSVCAAFSSQLRSRVFIGF